MNANVNVFDYISKISFPQGKNRGLGQKEVSSSRYLTTLNN